MADSFGSLFANRTPGPWDEAPASELAQVMARLNQYVEALAERDGQILSLIDEVARQRARGDRFKANGQRLLGEVKELRGHVEAIRNCGWKAMSKATHPDTGLPEDCAARTEIFKLVQLIFAGRA